MVNDEPVNPGELREDIPLRPSESSGFANKFGGVKLIIISFALLSIAVTVALATQIYYGDFEVVPHGSVATDSQECSSIGTNVLKAGGNAVDAAVAAAFCLSVVNPHSAGLDAAGTMMMYDYRRSRRTPITPKPIVVDFTADSKSNIPLLVKGLAFIHNRFGKIEWEELVLPAAELARTGFSVPNTLVMALQSVGNVNLFGPIQPGHILKLPSLASFLYAIANSSVTSFIPEASVSGISTSEAASSTVNDTTIYMPAKSAAAKLMKFLNYSNVPADDKFHGPDAVRTATNIKMIFPSSSSGSSSTIAVIDKNDVYISLIIGLNSPLGSQKFATGGFILNELPQGKSDNSNNYMPIIITPEITCGQRIVLSCGEVTGAAQVIESLLKGKATSEQLASALENPRLQTLNDSVIAYERSHSPIFNNNILETLRLLGTVVIAPEPYPTCNGIQQLGDDLISHSDSRGGGIASRF